MLEIWLFIQSDFFSASKVALCVDYWWLIKMSVDEIWSHYLILKWWNYNCLHQFNIISVWISNEVVGFFSVRFSRFVFRNPYSRASKVLKFQLSRKSCLLAYFVSKCIYVANLIKKWYICWVRPHFTFGTSNVELVFLPFQYTRVSEGISLQCFDTRIGTN